MLIYREDRVQCPLFFLGSPFKNKNMCLSKYNESHSIPKTIIYKRSETEEGVAHDLPSL